MLVRSTGSFMVTANIVKEKALREKHFEGSQYLLLLSPMKASAAIARVHKAVAAATYNPIHGIVESSLFCTSSNNWEQSDEDEAMLILCLILLSKLDCDGVSSLGHIYTSRHLRLPPKFLPFLFLLNSDWSTLLVQVLLKLQISLDFGLTYDGVFI